MINLADYLEFVDERRSSFDNQCNALRMNRNLTTLAALYMDLLTSNLGEKWDNSLLFRELDDVIEELKEQGVMFRGQEISTRRTDKDDPFVIKFIEVVPRTTVLKDENGDEVRDEHGKVVKQANGTKEVTKKKHIHTETMDIMNAPKTNAFGIPVCKLYGEYHTGGFYPTVNTYQSMHNNDEKAALRVSSVRPATEKEFKNIPSLYNTFFADITDRSRYGLSTLSEITVSNNRCNKAAGLIRLDYDLEDGRPVVSNIIIFFNAQTFVQGHVTARNLMPNTMAFIKAKLEEVGMAYASNCRRNIICAGSYAKFEATVNQAETNSRNNVAVSKREIERIQESVLRHERLEEEAAAREAELRRAEKERLKKEREQERLNKAADKADRAVKKHAKDVENMMTTLVASILNAGGTPGRAVYRSMREDIENDVATGEANLEDVELIFEALDMLIAQDTNA